MCDKIRRFFRTQRKREETKGYMRTALLILVIVCIIIVCVTKALQTKDSQPVAAKPQAVRLIDVISTADIARAAKTGHELIETSLLNIVEAMKTRMIVIDPGHGGKDVGCDFGGVMEKDINMEIALVVAEKLEDRGYEVFFVRQGDEFINKKDRVELANKQDALLYVSIHQNSYKSGSISGIETWYSKNDETGESKRLAEYIQQEAVSATGAVSRALVADNELYILNHSNIPTCLIETGFLSNKEERTKLCTEEYREQLAEGIVAGIELYLNSKEET